MLKVGFVVVPGHTLMSLAALSVFEFANLCTRKDLYEVQIFSEHGGAMASAVGACLVDTVAFKDVHLDTLIVGGNPGVFPTSEGMKEFLCGASTRARRTSSICTGAFALADAGLLRGRLATTHWMFTEELRNHPTQIRVQDDVLFVVDGSIWTAAGNAAGVDLALGMLESDHGAELARTVARILVVDHQRAGRQPQRSALLEINAKSDRMQDVLAHARRNLKKDLSMEDLARVAALGTRQFSRAFRQETGKTPSKAIENLRVEAARVLIEHGQLTVEEVASETGFGDEERMRRAFLRVTGQSPRSLRKLARSARQLEATPEPDTVAD